MFEDFQNIEATLEDAIKEAGYYKGYDVIFDKTYFLDESDEEDAKILVKKMNALRAALYRAKHALEVVYVEKQGKLGDGTFDLAAETQWNKDLKVAEDKIWVLVLDVLRLRILFDNFLALNDIDIRKPYNPKEPRLGKKKREALGLPPA